MTIKFILFSLFLPIFFSGHPVAGQDNIRFHHITLEEGLSQNSSLCIVQDSMGFMWFGTQDGLNKYDGYDFNIYRNSLDNPNAISDSYVLSILRDRNDILWIGTFTEGLNKYIQESDRFIHFINDPDDPTSLSNNYVSCLYESSAGVLWVGTYAGLNQFDSRTERFKRYLHEPENSNSLSNDRIHSISESRDGLIWIGTTHGLNKYDPQNHQFTSYFHQPGNSRSLSHDTVRSVFQDRTGTIWAGTDSGLNRYDPKTDQFIQNLHDTNDHFSISDDRIKIIYEDGSGTLWIGTDRGLNKYDRPNNRFITYQRDPLDPYSLNDDSILSIYEDQTGGLWLGTYGGGVVRIDKVFKEFKRYTYRPESPGSLSSKIIQAVFTDPQGDGETIWIGTQSSGLDRFDRKKNQITNFKHQENNSNSLSGNNIRAVCVDRSGLVWIGTQGRGLNRYDPEKQQFKHYLHNPNNPNSLSDDYIRVIHEDKQGILWIGTYEGGLERFDKSTEQFTHFAHQPDNPNSLSLNRIIAIFEDSIENLWIGTSFGLNKFEKESGQFTLYTHNPNDSNSLSYNRIQCIQEDKTGIIWIGTYGGGFNRFDRKTGKFTRYREEDGLPNNVVYGILEDRAGCLWLSTNKGLSKFDPKTQSFRNYDVEDGLQSNEFNAGAYHKSQSGEMFFGGIDGVNAFYPQTIKSNPFIPPVVITDFQLFNKSVDIGERSVLKQHINLTKEITLSHKDRVISFEFAALNFISSEKNRFRYKMENFDADWTEIGGRNFVSYTSLPPGNYTFRVRGSNNDGLWNEEGASLKIRITPPFWQTWWFRGAVLLALLLLIMSVFWFKTRAFRERAKELEIRVAERTNELDQTNRDLQQEITDRRQAEEKIQASLIEKEVLLKEIHHRVKNNMQIISSILRIQSRNIKDASILEIFNEGQSRIRSMALIHETLYQSSDLSQIDFALYIRKLTSQLSKMYRGKTGDIQFILDIQSLTLDIDRAIPCGLIINELVSNSLKHAFPGMMEGTIEIKTDIKEKKNFTILVSDNGKGIPETIDINNTDTLGMQLTLSLVNQLEGNIELQREKGTAFKISFRLD